MSRANLSRKKKYIPLFEETSPGAAAAAGAAHSPRVTMQRQSGDYLQTEHG